MIEWYVPLYTPSIPEQATLSNQFLSKLLENYNMSKEVFL